MDVQGDILPASSSEAVPAHKFPSLVERYYTQRYALDTNGAGEDLYVYVHTNGLMVIGLAPSHPLLVQQKAVKSIKFQSEHRDFTKNAVRGAKKKGGARLRPDGVLANIVCEDGTEFTAKCCVDASLLEVNSQLLSTPNLLTEWPATKGYLALCQPLPHLKNPADHLTSLEEYQQLRFPSSAAE